MSRAHSPTFSSLHLRHSSFSKPSVALPTSQLILQPFRRFTYVTAHSPILLLLHLRRSSFSNPSFASHTSQALQLDHLAKSSFSNLCVTSPTSQLILQPFRRFTYVTAHSPILLLLHLRRSSFSNPFFASPTSQALHLHHLASRPWSMQWKHKVEKGFILNFSKHSSVLSRLLFLQSNIITGVLKI